MSATSRTPSDDPVHDVHIRLDEGEWTAVSALATRVRMPVSAAVRLLVLRGLDREAEDPTPVSRRRRDRDDAREGDREVGLATLIAAEHTLLMLRDMAPGGAERAAKLEDLAAPAAQRRLERVAGALKAGSQ